MKGVWEATGREFAHTDIRVVQRDDVSEVSTLVLVDAMLSGVLAGIDSEGLVLNYKVFRQGKKCVVRIKRPRP